MTEPLKVPLDPLERAMLEALARDMHTDRETAAKLIIAATVELHDMQKRGQQHGH